MYRIVNLGREIKGEKLEEILHEAARKVGFTATSTDRQDTQYELGSVHEKEVYDGTSVRLKKGFLPIAQVGALDKDISRSWFSIRTGVDCTFPFFGLASKRQVERYLGAVSECFQAS